MNEKQFETDLRNAFPIPPMTPTLDAKIDRALSLPAPKTVRGGKLVLGFAATTILAVALFTLPAARADASFTKILDAMDRATRVEVRTVTVDEAGKRTPMATSLLVGKDLCIKNAAGVIQQIDLGDKSYGYDPTIPAYIIRPKTTKTSLRFSDMLRPGGELPDASVSPVEEFREDGHDRLRVTLTQNGLPERYVIVADAKTELPVRMVIQSEERGRWRTRQELAFRYDPSITIPKPDFAKIPAVTQEQADASFESAMTKETLAKVGLRRGRFVVRRIDVAEDGTVFVAYQSGERSPNTWRGYAINLKDDIGTEYVRVGQATISGQEKIRAKDGKIEIETFTPRFAGVPRFPRRLELGTTLLRNQKLARSSIVQIDYDDGRVFNGYQITERPEDGPHPVPLLSKSIPGPTCGAVPRWAGRLDAMAYGNDVYIGIAKAQGRAELAMREKRWPEAEAALIEQLRLMRESERKGYSPWSLDRPLKELDEVRTHLKP